MFQGMLRPALTVAAGAALLGCAVLACLLEVPADREREVLELMAAGKASSEVEVVSFDDIDESIRRFERGEATKGRLVAVRD